MIIENIEAFMTWLTSRLSRMCDADPTALAKYILALVKKERTEEELRELCLDQLDVFLMKETKLFVDLLFEVLKNKSYLQSSTDSLPKDAADVSSPSYVNPKTSPHSLDYNNSQNESNKSGKSEIDHRSDLENGARSKSSLSSAVKVKAIGSPEHSSHKSNRHTSRNRGDASEGRKRSVSDEKNDRNSKHVFFPSKKLKSKKYHYFKSSDDKFRDEKSDRRSNRRGKDPLSDGDDDIRKSTSRSNSWEKTRSRSRSSSRSSRSRSRERSLDDRDKPDFHSKSDSLKIQHIDHGDTDYRQKPHPVASQQLQGCNSYSTKRISKRCQDYDERGYCLRGDLCLFDHGTDPILVDDVSSVLNFGVVSQDRFEDTSTGTKSPKQPPPPSSPPPLPPPPPPLPPLPPAGYVPEPYNPEAPGMNVVPRVNFWVPPPVHHMTPPRHPPPLPQATSGIPNILHGLSILPPSFHKTHRARELIGVPTVGNLTLDKEREKERNKDVIKASAENSENCLKTFSLDEKNKTSGTGIVNELKRKSFDYNRLGANPRKIIKKFNNNRSTLEVRKIPQHLNTIAMLNSHFSKFGRIVNLQVGYDGDPEAALVQFMTDAEATAAYRCAEAILNNRFIKVFYHNPQKKEDQSSNFTREISVNTLNKTHSSQENNSNEINVDETRQSESLKPNMQSTIYTSKGNLSRTVFIPSVKRTVSNFNTPSTPAVPIARRLKEDQRKKKDTMQKRLELHKKKQEFLKSQITHQKVILDKLSKCKNEKEKEFLKQTIQSMSEKISTIQNEVKKESLELKNLLKSANAQSLLTKTEAERELLDAEMDLYNKQHTGDDTAELLSRVNELKKKAKALGLLDNLPHSPMTGIHKHGNSRYSSRTSSAFSHHSIDHRPRKLLVTGAIDKDSLKKHFTQFGNIEKIEETPGGLTVTFNTRIEAEGAYIHGSRYGDTVLSVNWVHDPQSVAIQNPDHNNDSDLKEVTSPVPEDDEEEEDEEEDSEARSWRR